jgi:hypothetical protein
MPSNIDEVRALIMDNGFPTFNNSILDMIDRMETSIAKRIHKKGNEHREVSNKIPINPDNCKLEVLLKGRLSKSRLEIAKVLEWFRNWIKTMSTKEFSNSTFSEMRDVILYASSELKRQLNETCSVKSSLFEDIFSAIIHLFNQIQDYTNQFLEGIDDLHLKQCRDLEQLNKVAIDNYEMQIISLKSKASEKDVKIKELINFIRQTSVKIGSQNYAIKHLRAENRQFEEINGIIMKENYTITSIIEKALEDLRGREVGLL